MNDIKNACGNSVVSVDDVRQAIDAAGYKASPALESQVARMVRECLRESLVTRAFNSVRLASRRKAGT
jgi:hypothetical protein